MPDELSPIRHAWCCAGSIPTSGWRGSTRSWSSATCSAPSGSSAPGAGSAPTARSSSTVFATEVEAGEALEAIARVKRRRGYRDL